eukprot:sb/3461513/
MGFLKRICTHHLSAFLSHEYTKLFQCHNSNNYYYAMAVGDGARWSFNATCPQDPQHYEMCGYLPGVDMTSLLPQEGLCGVGVCPTGVISTSTFYPRAMRDICNPESRDDQCRNIQQYDGQCRAVELIVNCDGLCDEDTCRDEIHCGSFIYGYKCRQNERYRPAWGACILSGFTLDRNLCNMEGDTRSCDIGNDTASCTVKHAGRLFTVPIFNFTRCATIKVSHRYKKPGSDSSYFLYMPNCLDFMDQTNCSDPARVALSCPIRGYMSTVAKVMVCGGLREGLCDDNLDILCVDVTSTCTIHKHQICDNILDCPTGQDEFQCKWMTGTGCKRKLRPTVYSPSFPLDWLGDGVEDCVGGADEMLNLWPTCGTGKFQRFVKHNDDCKDVFHCKFGPQTIIPSSLLCDGDDTCGNENAVCRRLVPDVHDRAVQVTIWNKYLGHCLPGLGNLELLLGNCSGYSSAQMRNSTIFGIERDTKLMAPEKFSCLYTFGELHVYLVCLGVCSGNCPISKSPLKFHSCATEIKNRFHTIANGNELTFVSRKEDSFGQDIFECENNKCLPFEKVCNLIDDCGDGSDEKNCENHFRCKTTKGQSQLYFPLYKVCDGVPNCMDLSDECNDRCRKEILQGFHLKGSAFFLGSLAIGLNLWTLTSVALELRTVENQAGLENRLLVITICIGDLLTGSYLLANSISDAVQGNYCERQDYWLASRYCDALGIVSTMGSAMSVMALTILSLFRVRGILTGLHRTNSEIRLTTPLILSGGIIIVSIVFAIFPVILLREFEDVFGNGQVWSEDVKFFIGKIDKVEHLEVIEAYYGRILRNNPTGAGLTWDKITALIRGMYTNDYGNFEGLNSLIGFYGNEAVCLFKFFVLPDDPQFAFSLTYQILNLICLSIICSCYACIEASSRKSLANLRMNQENVRNHNPGLQARIKRQQKIQRKVSMIIVTDLICWLPLLTVSFCHMAGVVDATPYYGIFSVIILPVNSTINPLLYSDAVYNVGQVGWKWWGQWWRRSFQGTTKEGEIEMNQIGETQINAGKSGDEQSQM